MIKAHIQDSIELKQQILNDETLISKIDHLCQAALTALNNGGKIILAGNGGSFADAQHISAEFTSRYLVNRKALASVALGCNSSSMSAIGNDYGYEYSFSRELEALGQENDLFIPISTSGNSPNILNAAKVAKEKNINTIALTGNEGGKLVDLCESIVVPSTKTGVIQESHIMIGHIMCHFVEQTLFG